MDPITLALTAASGIISGIGGYFTAREQRSTQQDIVAGERAAQAAAYAQEREAWEHREEMTELQARNQALLFANLMRLGAVAGVGVITYLMIRGD